MTWFFEISDQQATRNYKNKIFTKVGKAHLIHENISPGLIQEGLVPSPYRTHQRTRGGQRLAVALHRAAAVTGKRVFLQLGNEEIPQVFWIVEE